MKIDYWNSGFEMLSADGILRDAKAYKAEKGQAFARTVNQDDSVVGLDCGALYRQIYKVRNGKYADLEGKIPALKKQLADLGYDMSPSEQGVDLNKLLKDAYAYKEYLGDKFDGSVHRRDKVAAIDSMKSLYNKINRLRNGEYDKIPGVGAVKAKLVEMRYDLRTAEEKQVA